MRTWLLFFVVVIIFCRCKNVSDNGASFDKGSHSRDYDIEIKNTYNWKTDSLRSWSDKKFPKDSLYITCEFFFTNEDGIITMQIPDSLVLTILRNNKVFIKKTYKSKYLKDDCNDFFNFGDIKKIQNVGIRINNGNLAYIEIDSTRHVLRVRYDAMDKKLKVDCINSVPIFR
jgi:hypothetical protein